MAWRQDSVLDQFEAAVFVTPEDVDAARAHSPHARLHWIPNGVDTDYFAPNSSSPVSSAIVFHGNMDFPPNVNAAIWLADTVWPTIRAELPEARLVLVGRNPTAEVSALAAQDTRVVVTGTVADVRPYLHSASVYVAPLVDGSGIKNKVLEAMSSALPIVLTPLAAQGIPSLRDGTNCLIAAGSDEFAKAVLTLTRMESLAAKIRSNARLAAELHHSWRWMQQQHVELMYSAIRMSRLPRGERSLDNK